MRTDTTEQTSSRRTGNGQTDEELLKVIRESIRSVRYGTVQIIIQDGRVIQIDKTEKTRFA